MLHFFLRLFRDAVLTRWFTDKQRVDRDEEVARKLNEEAYAEAGQLMECPCCYEEVPFEDVYRMNVVLYLCVFV